MSHNRAIWLTTVCFACLLSLWVVPSGNAAQPATRSFELTYETVVQEIPPDAKKVEIWLPYPTSTDYQTVEEVSVEAPGTVQKTHDPEYGNSILYVSVTDFEGPTLPLSMKFRVQRKERLQYDFKTALKEGRSTNGTIPEDAKRWLEPDRLVPIDGRIKELADEVTAGAETDLQKMAAIYDYVTSTMTYEKKGTGWGRGDIYYACDKKRGNCTDFHALFTGLGRAVGIPTKFVIGFPIPEDRPEGQVAGYHCWAEFFIPEYGWIPVDASEANKHPDKKDYFFGGLCQNRVSFTQGRDIQLNPSQHGEPLNYFIYPYVQVDGKEHVKVDRTFRFQNLPSAESQAKAASR